MFENWFSLILAVTTLIFSGNNPVECRIDVGSSDDIQHKGDEIILKAGGSLNLTCVGDTPLEWNYPKYDDIDESKSVINVTEEKKDGQYFAILSIKNAFYFDTGFFLCNPVDDIDKKESVFIYVEDDAHLLNVDVTNPWNFLYIIERKDFIVFCSPTTPKVKVTLETEEGEMIIPGKKFKGHDVEYSPRTGFTFKNIKSPSPRDSYVCRGEYNGKNESATFQVKIMKPFIQSPILKDISPSKLVVGSTLALNCSVRVGVNDSVTFDWQLPNYKLKKNHATITQLPSEIWIYPIIDQLRGKLKLEQSTLTIHNITSVDEGFYVCTVKNNDNAVNYNTISVKLD